jgi:hypothetical protein
MRKFVCEVLYAPTMADVDISTQVFSSWKLRTMAVRVSTGNRKTALHSNGN